MLLASSATSMLPEQSASNRKKAALAAASSCEVRGLRAGADAIVQFRRTAPAVAVGCSLRSVLSLLRRADVRLSADKRPTALFRREKMDGWLSMRRCMACYVYMACYA